MLRANLAEEKPLAEHGSHRQASSSLLCNVKGITCLKTMMKMKAIAAKSNAATHQKARMTAQTVAQAIGARATGVRSHAIRSDNAELAARVAEKTDFSHNS